MNRFGDLPPAGGVPHPGRGRRAVPSADLVRVVVLVERQALDDLRLIAEFRYGGRVSRSAVISESVRWLRAREARNLVRWHRIEAERRARAELDAQALALSREQRDELAAERTLHAARAIATGHNDPKGSVG